MPERGPAQLLLLFFLRGPAKPGWKLGLVVALIALLGALPGEESVYRQAEIGLTQSLRQAVWQHALAGRAGTMPLPWDHAAPAAYRSVPRLGLSATLVDASGGHRAGLKASAVAAQDPHLALGDVAVGDRITVTTANGLTHTYRVTGREVFNPDNSAIDASPVGASDPHLACPAPQSTLAGMLRLIIEAVHPDVLDGRAGREQKL
jgi:hypothetical protein